jgi:hypothetical protein
MFNKLAMFGLPAKSTWADVMLGVLTKGSVGMNFKKILFGL